MHKFKSRKLCAKHNLTNTYTNTVTLQFFPTLSERSMTTTENDILIIKQTIFMMTMKDTD